MNEEKAIVAIAMFVCTAAVFAIKFISAAVLKYQENALKANAQPAGDHRLDRMEQAIDAIAVEVERISENQRFTTRLLTEAKAPSTKPPALKGRAAEN